MISNTTIHMLIDEFSGSLSLIYWEWCFLFQLKRALEELQEAIAEKEELKQRCQELDMQVWTREPEQRGLFLI